MSPQQRARPSNDKITGYRFEKCRLIEKKNRNKKKPIKEGNILKMPKKTKKVVISKYYRLDLVIEWNGFASSWSSFTVSSAKQERKFFYRLSNEIIWLFVVL